MSDPHGDLIHDPPHTGQGGPGTRRGSFAGHAWARWIPAGLLVLSLIVTAYGLIHRRFIFTLPWTHTDALRLILFGAAVLLVAAPTFIWLRRYSRGVGVGVFLGVLLVAAGVRPVLSVALVLLSAVCIGDLIVRRLTSVANRPLSAVALSALTGLALIAAVVGVLAHFPVNWIWVYVPLLLVPVVVSLRRLREFYWKSLADWFRGGSEESPAGFWAGVLVLALFVLHLVRVVQPAIDWDGLGVHEMIASTMAFDGRWGFDFRAFQWSLWPLAADWLLSVGWILGGEVAARLVNFATFVLACGVLHVLMSRIAGRSVSRLLIAVLASSSLAMGLTQNTFADSTISAFMIGAFAVIVLKDEASGWPWAVVVGVLLGGGLLAKASAAYFVLPLGVLAVILCVRNRGAARAVPIVAILAAAAIAVSASAYVYAFVKTGNPVFPLYNSIFHSSYAPSSANLDERWTGHLSLKLPYTMTFATSSYMEGWDGGLGFQYLILFPAGFATAVLLRRRSALLAAAMAVASGVLLLVSIQYVRYLFPSLVLAMVVCAAAFLGTETGRARIRTWLVVVAVAVVGLNLYFMPSAVFGWWGFGLPGLFSRDARHEMVVQAAPWWVLNGIVNEEAGSSARVAYLNRLSGAGLEGTPVYPINGDPSFLAALAGAKSSADVMAAFRARSVDYVIIDSLAGPGFPGDLPAVKEALAANATPIATVGGATLYRLDAGT